MKQIVRVATQNGYEIISEEQIKINCDMLIGVDASTSNTGVHIINIDNGIQGIPFGCSLYSFSLKPDAGENPAKYKVELKDWFMRNIINRNYTQHILYEEPFIGHPSAIPNLMMLRTSFDELMYEKPILTENMIVHHVSNKRWKKIFVAPQKVMIGTEYEKKQIQEVALACNPFTKVFSEDEFDAYGLCCAGLKMLMSGELSELDIKKKVKPFNYEVAFIPCDYFEDMSGVENDLPFIIEQISDAVPDVVIENGTNYYRMNGVDRFDQSVYNTIGDSDILGIVHFEPRKHGNVVLKYRLSPLKNSRSIIALCWRKARKAV